MTQKGGKQDRVKEKTEELTNLARESISKYWNQIGFNATPRDDVQAAISIVNHMIRVTPPEEEPIALEFIAITEGGRGGGRSMKPGNITLNIGKLVAAVATSGLVISASVAVPWTAPFAAIAVWDALWSNIKAELTEREAAIIWAMWLNRDENNHVSHAGLLNIVNSELGKYGRGAISTRELIDSLRILRRMKCIQHAKSDPSKWWLREWVSVKYE